MTQNQKQVPASGIIVLLIVFMNILVIKMGYMAHANWYWALVIALPLLILAIVNIRQDKNAILKNFPVIGYLFYFFKYIRPGIIQNYLDANQPIAESEKKAGEKTRHFKWITKLVRSGASSESTRNIGPVYSRTIQAAFDNAEGHAQFLQQFREFANGEPVDLKICIEDNRELVTGSDIGTIKVNARLK